MAQSSEIDTGKISDMLSNDDADDKLNITLLVDNTHSIPKQSDISTSDSNQLSLGLTSQLSLNEYESLLPPDMHTASELFSELIIQWASPMAVQIKSTSLTDAIVQICTDDEDVENQWRKTISFYQKERKCSDYQRIKNELYLSFRALISDERQIMLGLDSLSSLKHLLLTAMKICTKPDFQLEIRTGLGGTKDSLTLRTPAYAIPGLELLQRLIRLREQFSTDQPSSDSDNTYIPTVMLNEPPVLTFFCAYTAAVRVNKFDSNIAKENAEGMLSYIKIFIDLYHPNLSRYVQYEIDHENTYDDQLLKRIIHHYKFDYKDGNMKQSFTDKARGLGGNEDTAAEYVSMHLIMFKDVVDRNHFHLLFHPLNGIQNNRAQSLFDCIITMGGSVEKRFNDVRHAVAQLLKQNNNDNYYSPLSIRMLSEVGQTPVYYHNELGEITLDQILTNPMTNFNLKDGKYKGIRKDISILREDSAISALKSISNYLPFSETNPITTWENTISILINWFIDVWLQKVQDSSTIIDTINQIRHPDTFTDYLNQIGSEIIDEILTTLEGLFCLKFGKLPARVNHNKFNLSDAKRNKINDILDSKLNGILLKFLRNDFLQTLFVMYSPNI